MLFCGWSLSCYVVLIVLQIKLVVLLYVWLSVFCASYTRYICGLIVTFPGHIQFFLKLIWDCSEHLGILKRM